ncbi:hypothetical protein D3C76_952450 [compost metagenome]
MGQHRLLRGRRRRGQKATEVAGQFLGSIQLASQAQRPAVQHDQPRRADQQTVGQVHLPAQQHADILLGQQLLLGQTLHQVGGNIEVAGTQSLLHRLVQQVLSFKPAAGPQMQSDLRFARLSATQQVGEQMVIAEPVPMLVQRHKEHLMRLQEAQDGGTVVAATHRIAKRSAETLLAGGFVQEGLHVRR